MYKPFFFLLGALMSAFDGVVSLRSLWGVFGRVVPRLAFACGEKEVKSVADDVDGGCNEEHFSPGCLRRLEIYGGFSETVQSYSKR